MRAIWKNFESAIRNESPTTWEEFEGAIRNVFIPFHSLQRSRDKLRRLVQRSSVFDYLSDFRNIGLMILGVNEGNQLVWFCQGLKPHIKLEYSRPETEAWVKLLRSL